jgi:hypothetical protein
MMRDLVPDRNNLHLTSPHMKNAAAAIENQRSRNVNELGIGIRKFSRVQ